jgi:predicted PurR-regulated permease PerM
MTRKPEKIEISHRTIVFTVVFLASLWFLYFIRDVILQVFLALVIMTILNPVVTKLHRKKVPRAASVMVVYVTVFAILGFLIAQVTPLLIEQTTNFASSVNTRLAELNLPGPITEQITQQTATQVGKLPSQLIVIGASIFTNIFSVFTVLIFALYFLLSREDLDKHLVVIFKDNLKQRENIKKIINLLEIKLGGWARGQIILMLLVGLVSYIGLLILGVPFALPLAMIAGLLEIVPNIGPIIAAFPAVIVGFGVSPLTGFAVAALAFLIQQVENYVLVPKIMQKQAGLSPIITLLALVIGLKVAGIVGAILSIPIVITTQIVFEVYFNNKNHLDIKAP